ncbi:YdeI/OmpD-associated family protein [Flavobacterium sp. MAH-1]|uniref:YdeI/OmpD-associated family protein n=1 Tax=Flavobacterium agri TaxID=2743471 RepID=A0A7Y9C7I2_9FLAO|nr:YdeI/OmpD-associated family protein [Flavobacterium agri]NUY81363.1 YdeI/OmpD-associated family protein [Flavobacterium agri]NYA71387.1 YdeI/OmpD-associated family protein [Flavobacterium agri]
MLKKGEHIEGIPSELQQLLDSETKAQEFFDGLTKSCKQAYCDWVGSAKKEETRHTRAGKALLMLLNKQKTLKVV